MDSDQLSWFMTNSLKGTKSKFLGVFPSDHQPCLDYISQHAPCGYILNTDPCTEPGTHWVAFYHANSSNLEFFDSFGKSPSDYPFSIPNTLTVKFNSRPIQQVDSYFCGHYCIMFLYQRTHGLSLPSIVNHLSNLTSKKCEQLVYSFVSNLEHRLKK